jgi:peroxiredoxin
VGHLVGCSHWYRPLSNGISPTASARLPLRGCYIALWKNLSVTHPVRADATLEKNRNAAVDFTLLDASGTSVRLSDFKGKVVPLNFWATWCGGCQVEIPWFIEFEKEYQGNGFAVIGVSMDNDGWKSVKPYIKEKKINYSIGIGNKDLGSLYGLDSMPMTLLIDRSGRIASTHIGLVAKTDYRSEIETLLTEKSIAPLSTK